VVSARTEITPELFILQVTPDGTDPVEFEPGQYGELAIPEAAPAEQQPAEQKKFVRRPYSIASSPTDGRYLEFFIVSVAGGELTPKLQALPVGTRLWLGPKIKGKFTLNEVPEGKDLVLIGTGTGLAPFISMVRKYRHTGRWRNVAVIHCTRLASELGYREELEQYAESDSNFKYIPTVTREPAESSWSGLRGRVQPILDEEMFQKLAGFKLNPEEVQVMMCGNPEMIESVQQLLELTGFKQHSKKNPGNIHFERFW